MHDGIIGLILYLAHWLSPGADVTDINIEFLRVLENRTAVFQCQLETSINRQLEQLIDAGIPLRFKFSNLMDENDSLIFFRTLQFDMSDFTYMWTDSSGGHCTYSEKYTLIHLAMRDFCKWRIETPQNSTSCRIEVTILPSRAEQLNKVIDMSKIWGQQRVVRTFNPASQKNRPRQQKAR